MLVMAPPILNVPKSRRAGEKVERGHEKSAFLLMGIIYSELRVPFGSRRAQRCCLGAQTSDALGSARRGFFCLSLRRACIYSTTDSYPNESDQTRRDPCAAFRTHLAFLPRHRITPSSFC